MMLDELVAVDTMKLALEAGGTIRALSNIGYELRDALADIIDNSIDAAARRVEVTFFRTNDALTKVMIADDGCGMDAAALRLGMQFAGRTSHKASDLGAYGVGLKSASFSQCKTVTVISRRNGTTVACRWSVESINLDWTCELLEPTAATAVFTAHCLSGRNPATGTIVIWDRLTRLGVTGTEEDLDEFLSTSLARLDAHLGLVFHRFLESGRLRLSVVVRHQHRTLALPRPVQARDPFGYPKSGLKGYPKVFKADLSGVGTLDLTAHVWPIGSLVDGFLLGSKSGAPYQGFFVYRNDRIIQAGGWNGVVKNNQDPDLVEARVAIELSAGVINVNIQKSGLQVTASQAQAFQQATAGAFTFDDYLSAARKAHVAARRSNSVLARSPLVPRIGLPSGVRQSALKRLAKNKNHEPLDFAWESLDKKEVFRLDLTDTRLILNRNYRRLILGDMPASRTDVPVIKMLLFLLFKDDFERLRFSTKRREYLQLCNALLLDALKK